MGARGLKCRRHFLANFIDALHEFISDLKIMNTDSRSLLSEIAVLVKVIMI